MTDLDQRLAEAFEHRASMATGGVAPAAVTRAVRRRRHRVEAGAVGGVVLAAAAVVAIAAGQSRVSGGLGGSEPTPGPSVPPPVTLASVHVAATGDIRFVSYATKPTTTYEICEVRSCAGLDLPKTKIVLVANVTSTHADAVYGLAPAGTTKVLVSIGDHAFETATLATVPLPGNPQLFALAHASVTVDEGAIPRTDERFRALGAHGQVLSAIDVLGSSTVGQRHPAQGDLLTLPAGSGVVGQVAWGSAPQWVCMGYRQSTGAAATYRATSCQEPPSPSQPFAITGATSLGRDSKVTSSWQLFWFPAEVATVTMQMPDGHDAASTIVPAAGGKLVLLSAKNAQIGGQTTLTAKTSTGHVVFSGSENALEPANNTSEVAGFPTDVTSVSASSAP